MVGWLEATHRVVLFLKANKTMFYFAHVFVLQALGTWPFYVAGDTKWHCMPDKSAAFYVARRHRLAQACLDG